MSIRAFRGYPSAFYFNLSLQLPSRAGGFCDKLVTLKGMTICMYWAMIPPVPKTPTPHQLPPDLDSISLLSPLGQVGNQIKKTSNLPRQTNNQTASDKNSATQQNLKNMKNTKSILMAAAAALTIASASAQEVVYITGATAFRSAANNTLYSLYSNNLLASSGSSTTDSGAISLYFTNCLLTNGSRVDIAVTWTGSEGGMQTVASGTNNKRVPFYDLAKLTSNSITSLTTGLAQPDTTNMLAGSLTSLQKGIIGCSDSFQASSRFQGGKKASDGATYTSLAVNAVGVVPYAPIASKGYTNTFPDRNMTLNNMYQILTAGFISGEKISGNTNHTTVKLFATGRNIDSGTRVIALATLKGGIADQLTQWKVTAGSGTATAMVKHPATTINGIATSLGEGGETSGGTVAGYMTNVITSATTVTGTSKGSQTNYLVGYVSVADITAARRTAGLVPLKFNGVEGRCHDNSSFTTLDAGYTNIITGAYPWWGYEFVTYDNAVASANAKAFANNFISQIKSFDSTNSIIAPNIKLTDMKVTRTVDGGNQ